MPPTSSSAAPASNASTRGAENDAGLNHLSKEQLSDLDRFLLEDDDCKALAQWILLSDLPITARNIDDLNLWLTRQIAELDARICDQVNTIIHHPRFQEMEARWLGLWRLIDESSHAKNIKVKLLDISWKELSRDVERSPDYDQSQLFNLVYNEEFGKPGGEPYGVLLGDYYIAHQPNKRNRCDDIFTLQSVAHTAAAAFAPFICSAAPELFGLDSFEELNPNIDFGRIFAHPDYQRWNGFREQEDTRFIALTMPQVLMREPHNMHFSAHDTFRFREECSGKDASQYLWGNACFAFGTVLMREFQEVGWFAHVRGASRDHLSGGLVTRFSAPYSQLDTSFAKPHIVTPSIITDNMERQLSELGLMALCQGYDSAYAVFNSCPSLQRPRNYGSKSANANARISAMVQQILCGSRFAQYVKVIIRSKIGSFTSAAECQRTLQSWFDKYTTGREDLSWDMMARYPLRKARVIVSETAGHSEVYQCVIYLKSHYTVDHLVSELKLATTIAKSNVGQAI